MLWLTRDQWGTFFWTVPPTWTEGPDGPCWATSYPTARLEAGALGDQLLFGVEPGEGSLRRASLTVETL